MTDGNQNWEDLGVVSALATNYSRDAKAFLETLATTLESVLPEQVNIERKRGLFVKAHPVVKLEITFGDHFYVLHDPGHGRLVATHAKAVRGITLKTDDLAIEDWISQIGSHLQELEKHSEKTYYALKEFLR
jgi:hypothetical protein